jgi:hypothetical protein
MTTSVLCTPLLAQTILFRLQPQELSLFLHIIPPLHYFFDLLTHQHRHFTNLILAAVMVGMDNGEIDEGPVASWTKLYRACFRVSPLTWRPSSPPNMREGQYDFL